MRISDWSSDGCSSDLLTVTRHLSTPVNFIVHSLMDVNDQLARGRPFFADIARDGIALYEAPGQGLAMPRQLDAQERHAEALRHRDHWFPLAAHALTLAQDRIPRSDEHTSDPQSL